MTSEQTEEPLPSTPGLDGPLLRAEIRMHAAEAEAALFGVSSVEVVEGTHADVQPPLGLGLGRFALQRKLGQGGMGAVYQAYDAQLSRAVAIKLALVRSQSREAERESQRLLREATALAQLSHPNVVQVHEVGTVAGQVFIVMELVQGPNLRRWLAEALPRRRELLDVFAQAARGLAAAHAVGIVHRDFKLGNVVIGEDGRVRVVDFGLAVDDSSDRTSVTEVPTAAASGASGSASRRRLSSSTIVSRGVTGTPPYMAPEQHRGEAADARSDQYSFCVALFEALYGARPFAGRDLDAMLDAKLARRWTIPPNAPSLPAHLSRALERGLSPEPHARFGSMEELCEILLDDPARRWRRAALATVVVGALGTTSWLAMREVPDERCTGAEHELSAAWGHEQRDAVEEAFRSRGKAHADEAWERIGPRLDKYAERWVAMHRETCEATTIRGEQSSEVMDLRMGCLGRAELTLRATTNALADADDGVVLRAGRLVDGLDDLERCTDVEALRAGVEPPEAFEADAVVSVRERLAAVRVDMLAGRYDRGRQGFEETKACAEGVSYGPLQTELALAEGFVLSNLGDVEGANHAFERVVELGMQWGQRVEVRAASGQLIFNLGVKQGRFEEAMRLEPFAQGLSRGSPELEADLLGDLGVIAERRGNDEQAKRQIRQAISLLEQMDPSHRRLAPHYNNLGVVLVAHDDHREAEAAFERAMDLHRLHHGASHPLVASTRDNLALCAHAQGRFEDAEAEHRRALVAMEAVLGSSHPSVAAGHINVGWALYEQGRYEEARGEYQRGTSIFEDVFDGFNARVIDARIRLSWTLIEQGRLADAEKELARVLEHYDESQELNGSTLADARLAMMWVLLETGHTQPAAELAEPVWAEFRDVEPGTSSVARAAFASARVLWETGGDEARAQARARVRRAEETLSSLGERMEWIGAPNTELAARIREWKRLHGVG